MAVIKSMLTTPNYRTLSPRRNDLSQIRYTNGVNEDIIDENLQDTSEQPSPIMYPGFFSPSLSNNSRSNRNVESENQSRIGGMGMINNSRSNRNVNQDIFDVQPSTISPTILQPSESIGDDYKSYPDTESYYTDGRFFNLALNSIPGLISEPLDIYITEDVTGSQQLPYSNNISIGFKVNSLRYEGDVGILRMCIHESVNHPDRDDTHPDNVQNDPDNIQNGKISNRSSYVKHCNVLLIQGKNITWFDPDLSSDMHKVVGKILKNIFPKYNIQEYRWDSEQTQDKLKTSRNMRLEKSLSPKMYNKNFSSNTFSPKLSINNRSRDGIQEISGRNGEISGRNGEMSGRSFWKKYEGMIGEYQNEDKSGRNGKMSGRSFLDKSEYRLIPLPTKNNVIKSQSVGFKNNSIGSYSGTKRLNTVQTSSQSNLNSRMDRSPSGNVSERKSECILPPGHCVAYCIKFVIDILRDSEYDPSDIEKFVSMLEMKYSDLLVGDEDVQYGPGGGFGVGLLGGLVVGSMLSNR